MNIRAHARRDAEWLGIELRHLAALSAVAEEGTFRAAAQRLGYVQSAISQQISALESIVGVTLVERGRGGGSLRLSPTGRFVLGCAEAVLAEMRIARAELRRIARDAPDALHVGATHDVAVGMVPEVLAAGAQHFADAAIELVERTHDSALLKLVREASLDIAFAELPLPAGPYEHLEVFTCPWVLLGTDAVPTLEALARLPLLATPASRAFGELRARFQLAADGVQADVWQTVRALALASAGPALVPARFAGASRGFDLGELLPRYRLALVWHRDRPVPDLAQRFAAAAASRLA